MLMFLFYAVLLYRVNRTSVLLVTGINMLPPNTKSPQFQTKQLGFGKSHPKIQLVSPETQNHLSSIKWSYSIKIILSLNVC